MQGIPIQLHLKKLSANAPMKKPYIFYFTRFTRSNGIRVMMILSEKLIDSGYPVLYYVPDKTNWPKHIPTINALTKDLQDNGIVVYPEIVAGNPLRVRNVARLVLFYPGKNGGMKKYHHSEMVFAYLPEFLPGADILTIPWIDDKLFNNPGLKRTQDCCSECGRSAALGISADDDLKHAVCCDARAE